MLTDAELDAMRDTAAQALPGTAIIQSQSVTDDSGGGGSVSWTAAGTVACRVAPMSGNEREIADRIAEDAKWVITLPAETAITTKQRIVAGGGTFNVLAVRAPRSYEITRRVEVGEEV